MKLPLIQNWLACFMTKSPPFARSIPLLCSLYWLPVKFRILFKISCWTTKPFMKNSLRIFTQCLPHHSHPIHGNQAKELCVGPYGQDQHRRKKAQEIVSKRPSTRVKSSFACDGLDRGDWLTNAFVWAQWTGWEWCGKHGVKMNRRFFMKHESFSISSITAQMCARNDSQRKVNDIIATLVSSVNGISMGSHGTWDLWLYCARIYWLIIGYQQTRFDPFLILYPHFNMQMLP